jgi:hypothetical protein
MSDMCHIIGRLAALEERVSELEVQVEPTITKLTVTCFDINGAPVYTIQHPGKPMDTVYMDNPKGPPALDAMYQALARIAYTYLNDIEVRTTDKTVFSVMLGKTKPKDNKEQYEIVRNTIDTAFSHGSLTITYIENPNQDYAVRKAERNYKCHSLSQDS